MPRENDRLVAWAMWPIIGGPMKYPRKPMEPTKVSAEAAGMDPANCRMFDTHDALAAALHDAVLPGDALLFKGAHHATHMEYCMQKFYALMEAQ